MREKILNAPAVAHGTGRNGEIETSGGAGGNTISGFVRCLSLPHRAAGYASFEAIRTKIAGGIGAAKSLLRQQVHGMDGDDSCYGYNKKPGMNPLHEFLIIKSGVEYK